jgi:hypothetical protein
MCEIDFDYLDRYRGTARRAKIAANQRATRKGARWKWHGSLGGVKVRYFVGRRAVSRLNVVVHRKNAVVYRVPGRAAIK